MKLDPRTKMVMVICLSTLAMIYNTPGRLALLLAATVLMLAFFHLDLGAVLGCLKPFLSLMLVLFVIQSVFTRGGEALLVAGPVPLVTSEGLLTGAGVVLRIAVVIAAALLFTTFSSRDFVLGLVQWKVPYELVFMVSIAIRFLPLVRDEMINVVTAIQLRGVELKKVPWGQKIKLCRLLLFPVIYGSMLKAQQLAVAMESRGFRAYPRRTCLRRLEFGHADYILMLIFSAVTVVLVALHFS